MVNDKKILYIITKSIWGGAGKYVYDLAVASKEKGYEVAVAAGGQGALAVKLQKKNISYFDVAGLQRDIAFLKPFISGLVLLKVLLQFKPDIAQANSPQAAGIGGIALFLYRLFAWKRGFQAIYTIHGWAFHEDRPIWQNFLIRLFSRITCFFYQKIICVSEYDRLSALKFKITPAHKLLTIHNGVDENEIKFLSKELALKNLNLLNLESWVVGTIGELTKNKGQKYLIDAVKLLQSTSYKLQAIIIGRGEENEKLKAQSEKLSLQNDVVFTENLLPAAPYLKAFDIFVLPSIKEGLPYTLLEAGLAELPVIATDVGGNPEIIENEKTGLLVKPANAEEIAKAISRLIQDENLSKKLGENLRQKVLKIFSKKEMLEKTFALYD